MMLFLKNFQSKKNQLKIIEFLQDCQIGVIWTTNYDDLIEKAFDNVQK